jgi:hypothetical protein
MARLFARIFAFILAASVFVIAAVLVFQVRPESTGGWIVMAILGAGALASPVLVYVAVMGRFSGPPLPNEGEGAGLAMGAGIDSARDRDPDSDLLDID